MTTSGNEPTEVGGTGDGTVDATAPAEADFSAITGVGAKTSAALTEAGISSLEELSAMSAGQVSSALEGVGVQISAGKIISQLWLQQAWMLSGQSEQPETEHADGVAPTEIGPTGGQDRTTGATDAAEASEEATDWQEQFGLFVYLDRSSDGRRWRTRIWDTTEMVEQQRPGIAPGLLVDLIIDRMGSFE